MHHGTTICIAAGAGNAAAIFSQLALGMSAAKIALSYHGTVPQAAATAYAALKHLTKVLKGAACNVVVTAAVELEAASAFLKADLTARNNAKIAGYSCSSWRSTRL